MSIFDSAVWRYAVSTRRNVGGWVFSGSIIDLDFTRARYFQSNGFTGFTGTPRITPGLGLLSETGSDDTIILTQALPVASAYSVLVIAKPNGAGAGYIFTLNDGTLNNTVGAFRTSGTDIAVNHTAATVSGDFSDGTDWATGSRAKIAIACANNDVAISFNGAAPATASLAMPSGLDQLNIGHRDSDVQLNGWIERVVVWGSRLSNAQLQALAA